MDKRTTWDAYRNDPRYRDLLIDAGVGGPLDLGQALYSRHVVVPAQDLSNDDPEILLGEYVLATMTAYKLTRARMRYKGD